MKLLLATTLYCLLSLTTFNLQASEIDKAAPNFTLKSNSGKNIRLSELKGQVVLINFWASWCGPCRQEMPKLQELHNKYQKLGFTVLGINVEKDASKANQIVAKGGISFPILYDSENTVSKLYNVSAMPSTVIVGRDGKQRYIHLGYKPGYEDIYAADIKRLIRE